MITEGYGSCFSIWRQTRAVFMRDAARNIKLRRQKPHPKYVAVRQIPPPRARERFECPGYAPGGGNVRVSNWSVHTREMHEKRKKQRLETNIK